MSNVILCISKAYRMVQVFDYIHRKKYRKKERKKISVKVLMTFLINKCYVLMYMHIF